MGSVCGGEVEKGEARREVLGGRGERQELRKGGEGVQLKGKEGVKWGGSGGTMGGGERPKYPNLDFPS